MGVYIKNMKMPTNCWFCSVMAWDDDEYVCPFSGRTVKSGDANRHEDCPLIELPDHGDLIDKNAFRGWVERMNGIFWAINTDKIFERIDNAPVIIPAERSEE